MKISFLASHGGSAAKHIISAIRANQLDAHVGIVITNNQNSEIYRWCIENAVEIAYISGATHSDDEKKDRAIRFKLLEAGTDLVILSGYMKKIDAITLAEYSNRIINIHPSLLPRHGGQGLYGDKVHESVLNSGDKQSGATVQFITAEYDAGPMISQMTVNVLEGETVESLKAKVQAIECDLYLNSIKKIISQN